jgi:hydroxymethylpyrimidine kinase/phosphomethylpyrimidine kinase
VLSIAGLDPSGGAGITADVKTIAALACFPAAVITSITFQNTQGVYGASHQTPQVIRSQVEPVARDLKIAAVKTGMLPTVEIIQEIARIFRDLQLPRPVVDPVMRATSGDELIEAAALEVLQSSLFPLAQVVTPNIPEAERLVGFQIESLEAMREAALVIKRSGANAVLVKGGHLPAERKNQSPSAGAEAVDILVDQSGTFTEFRGPFYEIGNVHGSGCTLSAAIAAHLGRGSDLVSAIDEAKRYVAERIRMAQPLGYGARPL